MAVLSIDTTGDYCSVAVLKNDALAEFHESRPREHAKILLQTIENVLSQANESVDSLTYIVCGRGPGSFTGIRIAASVAQGISFSKNIPLLPVSTLQSLAFGLKKASGTEVWSAVDARMSEIYFGRYRIDDEGVPEPIQEEQVIHPTGLPYPDNKATSFNGNGWYTEYEFPNAFPVQVAQDSVQDMLPRACHSAELAMLLLSLGRLAPVNAADFVPVYLRDKVTWDNKPKIGS